MSNVIQVDEKYVEPEKKYNENEGVGVFLLQVSGTRVGARIILLMSFRGVLFSQRFSGQGTRVFVSEGR